ncbi:phosphate transport system permease protein [Fluviicoccus keumensis]|uniref:Phosphate transport system permease protein n=1 Tax=Fluviicoccus keumensis TaxID=1435465 RepID=A0A4Q7ZCP1_9GAMM|nr:ABC transporter permease subunit [Fluviicoccus keumensis]RZU47783.1 phosphate transport system permease protein [Fluviicoccus keumensis]
MSQSERAQPDAAYLASLDRRRRIKDRFANVTIAFGGVFVIVAIALIFFYLLFESWPLFRKTELAPAHQYSAMTPASWVDMDEYNETGIRLQPNGEIRFFRVSDGQVTGTRSLNLPEGVTVSAVMPGPVLQGVVGVGLSNGQLVVLKPDYTVDHQGETRVVTPNVAFPFGEAPLTVMPSPQALTNFSVRDDDGRLEVLAVAGNQLLWEEFTEQKPATAGAAEGEGFSLGGLHDDTDQSGADQPKTYALGKSEALPLPAAGIRQVLIGQGSRWLYAFTADDKVAVFKRGDEGVSLYQEAALGLNNAHVTSVSALQGEISLLIGDSAGEISQWFLVRDTKSAEDKFSLQRIRSFRLGDAPVTAITPELKRKGFVAGDAKGRVGYFYTTSERTLSIQQAAKSAVTSLSLSQRSDGVFVQAGDSSSFWRLHSEHPDISMSSMWGKVWYESYPEPTYTWQSSSGNADFESKLSLVPLAFGTLKAAFFAMLLAAPLAICGAMYTAVFMSPGLRTKVKPAVELMQALPTVILGFLAGLWLAPLVEASLPGIVTLLIVTPIVILLCGFAWVQIPLEKRSRIPDGWAPVLLILPVVLAGGLSMHFSQSMELALFNGDVRHWMSEHVGLKFDQRNALIVGLVMGFAVIAPIFSIAEDALFAVPRHLTNGSLALGATQWQTLVRVVLPTASPGIFSAVMIGFGRAIGETMIVLMATGNTAVMNWNMFEGMRTLSANVAVEMAEAEVGSTHFRVLFLSALVLFVLTFVLNTVAEVVRTRLRKKYGSL